MASEGERPDFDAYVDSYSEAIERSIGFAGAPHELYTRIKADAVVDLAARRLGDPAGLAALDVGCGPGETDRMLRGRFARLAGADVAAGLVEVAAARNPWAEYAAYEDGDRLPFDDASFDLSFTICVLHHVPPPQWQAFLSEMARVTAPGGLVAVFEHNPYNPLARKVVRDCEFDEQVELLPRRRLVRLLAAAGTEPLESRYIVFFPRKGRVLRRAERALAPVPLGAQYYAAARRR